MGRRQRSSALSKNGDLSWFVALTGTEQKPVTYLAGISTKRCDILLYPLQSDPLVAQAEIEGPMLHSIGSLRETEGPNTVVDRHIQDRCSL